MLSKKHVFLRKNFPNCIVLAHILFAYLNKHLTLGIFIAPPTSLYKKHPLICMVFIASSTLPEAPSATIIQICGQIFSPFSPWFSIRRRVNLDWCNIVVLLNYGQKMLSKATWNLKKIQSKLARSPVVEEVVASLIL